MIAELYDARHCELGEGPLWHPGRQQLFWFDITGKKLLSRQGKAALEWVMPEMTSAAGWVDNAHLMLFGETGVSLFDIASGALERLATLEADNPLTRSNDGRADPQGGFWIGTMGKLAEPKAGAIYRYYKGEIRKLYPAITIPNAICFAPDGESVYFTDTDLGQVLRQRLGRDGWPLGDAQVFLDLRAEGLNPDGAVVDAAGHFWNAQWGAGRIAEYDADGRFLRAIAVPAAHSSCPAFGGPDLTTLFCTTAMQGHSAAERQANPAHGQTFAAESVTKGQAEHRVMAG